MKKIFDKTKQGVKTNQSLYARDRKDIKEMSIPNERELEQFKKNFMLACW